MVCRLVNIIFNQKNGSSESYIKEKVVLFSRKKRKKSTNDPDEVLKVFKTLGIKSEKTKLTKSKIDQKLC